MSTQNEPSDGEVRRFLERLYVRQFEFPDEVQMLIGQLPPDWDIPLPPNTTVVGTEVRRRFYARVVLDVPGEPEAAVDSITQPMLASGWRSVEVPFFREGGLMAGAVRTPGVGVVLCNDQRRWHVDVIASEGAGGIADVRVTLNSDPTHYQPCEPDDFFHHHSPLSIFPPLTPPPGMTQQGGGGGGGGDSAHSSATLVGTLGPGEIEEHYRSQLTGAGWELAGHGATDRWAWSAWDFTGEHGIDWTALLAVAQPRGLDQFNEVTLLASAAPGRAGLGGSSMSF